jgi:colanic acid biosynthesis protein WcaH
MKWAKAAFMDMIEAIHVIEQGLPSRGNDLPDEVFLLLTRLTPMINVDLLVRDSHKRILLAWRNDEYAGIGWHIPGGIIRMHETREACIQRTATREIGTELIFDRTPLECVDLIFPKLSSRSHFITLIYECRLPDGFAIPERLPGDLAVGELAWHEKYPEDMIVYHDFYRKYFIEQPKADF